ncbi:hypothetical protein PO002_23115 [Cupriavidus necator]|uniref:hypothetical protein n=1 Tax=Cupriavidus necator TaxID=106590 RepID=UPI0039C33A51
MQLVSNFLQRETDAERRHLSLAPRQPGQITRALDGHSVPFALFLGMLCAVPAALVGVLLIVIRL